MADWAPVEAAAHAVTLQWLGQCAAIRAAYAHEVRSGWSQSSGLTLSLALQCSKPAAEAELVAAVALGSLPRLERAARDRRLHVAHVKAVLAELECCAPDLVAAVVDDVVARTADGAVRPPARWRDVTRAAVLRADPSAADRRRRAATRDRHVQVVPAADGMAWVRALVAAEDALRVSAALDQRAHDLKTQGDPRASAQLHADLLIAEVTGAPAASGDLADVPVLKRSGGSDAAAGASCDGIGAGRRGSRRRRGLVADVHIPAAALTGPCTEPATLRGYGPITGRHAYDLLRRPGTVLRALFVDPATGEPLAHGRSWTVTVETHLRRVVAQALASTATVLSPEPGYAPSTALARLCLARDPRSLFPTSSVPAWRTDLDHRQPHDTGGPTSADNLGALDRGAHHLKQRGMTWRRRRDGSTRWKAPGRRAAYRPAPWSTPPPLLACRT